MELQVTDLEENVVDLDEDVDFLFDETVIQDQRLLNLEEASVQVTVELAEVNVNIQGKSHTVLLQSLCINIYVKPINVSFPFTDLETTDQVLDFRVSVLEENGGSDGNSSVAELEVRVETLEGTAAREYRVTMAEELRNRPLLGRLRNTSTIVTL